MAELVLGIGMSHSSLIATDDPEIWRAHGAIDRTHPYLRDRAGRLVSFEQLEAANGHPYEEQANARAPRRAGHADPPGGVRAPRRGGAPGRRRPGRARR